MPISEFLRELREKVGNHPLTLPAATAVIIDEQKRVLLMQSKEDGIWYLPGGGIDPGEQPADAVVREVFEETGLRVEPLRLLGVYADVPTRYRNGDVVYYVTSVFLCRVVGGEIGVNDGEAMDVRYFPVDALPAGMYPAHRLRIAYALQGSERAEFLRG